MDVLVENEDNEARTEGSGGGGGVDGISRNLW